MNGARQTWLVALREMRERARSRALWTSLLVTVLAVAGMIVVPALLTRGGGSRDIGLADSVPAGLPAAIESQASAVSITARIHPYPGTGAGEAAVRRGEVEVLVVDATRLEWRRQPDQQLRAVLTGAIRLVAVSDRAAATGIAPGALDALLAPVPVDNVQLGSATGRTPGDEMAALVMTVLLLVTISAHGALVLTGVVEEKTSRIVEVLLAHVPARSLLAGKVAGIGLLGIGLLGLAQISVTALAAFITAAFVRAADIPAIRGSVLAWAVVWFMLGYALYAMLWRTRLARVPDRGRAKRRRPGDRGADRVLLRVLPRRRPPRQRPGQGSLVLPGDRSHGHAQPHRHGGCRLVGTGRRRRAHPRRHCRARAVRRTRLHPRLSCSNTRGRAAELRFVVAGQVGHARRSCLSVCCT